MVNSCQNVLIKQKAICNSNPVPRPSRKYALGFYLTFKTDELKQKVASHCSYWGGKHSGLEPDQPFIFYSARLVEQSSTKRIWMLPFPIVTDNSNPKTDSNLGFLQLGWK